MCLKGKNLRRLFRFLLVTVIVTFAITLGINVFMVASASKRTVRELSLLPAREYALVLGTEPVRPDGSTNLHFIHRTDHAALVYHSGKVAVLLISGNQNNRGFNEVLEMKKAVMARQVPMAALKLDFWGTRTIDSIRRAKQTYQLEQLIIITSDFHAARALFLCRHFGLDAVAFCPDHEPAGLWSVRYQIREYFARVRAVYDLLNEPHEPTA